MFYIYCIFISKSYTYKIFIDLEEIKIICYVIKLYELLHLHLKIQVPTHTLNLCAIWSLKSLNEVADNHLKLWVKVIGVLD